MVFFFFFLFTVKTFFEILSGFSDRRKSDTVNTTRHNGTFV